MKFQTFVVLLLFVSLNSVVLSIKSLNNQQNLNDRLRRYEEEKIYNKKDIEDIKKQLDDLDEVLRKITNSKVKIQYPKNCKEVQEQGNNATGIYSIYPEFSDEPFLVVCDMDSKGGGWTIVLNRFIGLQEFNLDWNDYKEGFGNLAGEFWLGLENVHDLTAYEVNEVLIELEDWDGKEVYAHYSYFAVGSEDEDYNLKLLGGYSGTGGDSFSSHAGMKFTTIDKDNDRYKIGNCAGLRSGGWWYNKCANSLLTGRYFRGTSSDTDEFDVMFWEEFRGSKYSLKRAKMMVRPRDSNLKGSLD